MAAFPFPSSWSSCPPKDLTGPNMAVRNFQRAQLYFQSGFRPRTDSLLAHCGCERPMKMRCPVFYSAEGNGDSTHSGESRSWYHTCSTWTFVFKKSGSHLHTKDVDCPTDMSRLTCCDIYHSNNCTDENMCIYRNRSGCEWLLLKIGSGSRRW